MKYIIILIILLGIEAGAQQEYNFNNYKIIVGKSEIGIKTGEKIIEDFKFNDPSEFLVDLDNDGLNDFLVIDHIAKGERDTHTIYLFNTIDTVYVVDSIKSGYFLPYYTLSDELGEVIIITGNADFIKYENGEGQFIPINCYKYESGEILQINDELYDVFILENEAILEYIDEYFTSNIKNCTNTLKVTSALASAYANYINAGEPTLARQLIMSYYFCDDREEFVSGINELIYK